MTVAEQAVKSPVKLSKKEKKTAKQKNNRKAYRYNATVLAVLKALLKKAQKEMASVFKIRGYRKAIEVISELQYDLVYYYEVQALKTLNERTHEMIGQIIREGCYGEVGPDYTDSEEEDLD